MIELERDIGQGDTQIWADVDFRHVIVEETEETARIAGPGPGWYVRDENRETGPFRTFAQAFSEASERWPGITLAPANRLRAEIEEGRSGEVDYFLLEYLATYGTAGIDVQALARRVFERIEED